MANRPITITYGNPITGQLTLSDNGNTNVDPGDTVTWNIGPNSGVASITAISDDPNSPDVFSQDPAPVGNSGNWRGTVNPAIPANTQESYTICWIATSGVTPPCYDPKITVNP